MGTASDMSFEIVMPRAGLTMVEGTITGWKAAEGSRVTMSTMNFGISG